MSAGSFKQDGLGWRIYLIKRRIGEWIEYKTSQLNTDSWELGWLKSKLLWQIIKFCIWLLLAILLVWLTWQLWLGLRPYWKGWQRKNNHYSIIDKPTSTLKLSRADWLERSQAARIEGNYRQAIFCLYQAMLQLLDEREIIAARSSLTDEEYRRSLSKQDLSSLQAYELLLSSHQRLCFGRAQADRSLFEQCQQAYKQIEVNPKRS